MVLIVTAMDSRLSSTRWRGRRRDDGDTGKYAQIGQMNPSAACTIIVRMRSIERIDAMMSSSPPPVAGRGYVVSKQQRQSACASMVVG